MDNARDVVVDSNYVFSTDPNYYRGSSPATGILVGAETWPVIIVILIRPVLDLQSHYRLLLCRLSM